MLYDSKHEQKSAKILQTPKSPGAGSMKKPRLPAQRSSRKWLQRHRPPSNLLWDVLSGYFFMVRISFLILDTRQVNFLADQYVCPCSCVAKTYSIGIKVPNTGLPNYVCIYSIGICGCLWYIPSYSSFDGFSCTYSPCTMVTQVLSHHKTHAMHCDSNDFQTFWYSLIICPTSTSLQSSIQMARKSTEKNGTGGGSSDLEHAQRSARKQIGKSSGCRIRLWMSGKKACLGSGSMLEVTADWIEPVRKHEKLLTLDFSATFAVDVASKD